MEASFLALAVCLMFAGVHGASESESCSMVNNKWICTRQSGTGGAAASTAQSQAGPGGTYQGSYSGASGSAGDWNSNQQTVIGGGGAQPVYQAGSTSFASSSSSGSGVPIGILPFPAFGPLGFPGVGAFAFGRR